MDIFICVNGYDGLDRIINIKSIESIRECPDDCGVIHYVENGNYEEYIINKGYAKLKEALVCKAYDLSESVNVE